MPATLKMKELFFDRAKVRKAMDAATRRALSEVGAFVRRDARALLKVSKKPAPPGRPPHIRAKSPLKRLLFFAMSPKGDDVVIGPEAFSTVRRAKVPGVLEFGGRISVPLRGKRGRRKRARVTVHQKARPYMSVALSKNISTLPKHWRNSVKGGG